jgi:hypothetical protein
MKIPNVEVISDKPPPEDATDTWIGAALGSAIDDHGIVQNEYFVKMFSDIGTKLGLPTIDKLEYTDEDLLTRYNNFNEKYKNCDILIINSQPASGQYNLNSNKDKFNELIRSLSKKYKIVTTEKVDDITSTRDDNLKIKDIGAISTHCKYVIGISTGPIVPCFNTYAFKNVKKWFTFNENNYWTLSYPNFYMNVPLDEIESKLE